MYFITVNIELGKNYLLSIDSSRGLITEGVLATGVVDQPADVEGIFASRLVVIIPEQPILPFEGQGASFFTLDGVQNLAGIT